MSIKKNPASGSTLGGAHSKLAGLDGDAKARASEADVSIEASRSPPDLQALVEAHGFFCNVPEGTWLKYDKALQERQRRLRSKHRVISARDQEKQGTFFFLAWT
jgi:hypothetical protein